MPFEFCHCLPFNKQNQITFHYKIQTVKIILIVICLLLGIIIIDGMSPVTTFNSRGFFWEQILRSFNQRATEGCCGPPQIYFIGVVFFFSVYHTHKFKIENFGMQYLFLHFIWSDIESYEKSLDYIILHTLFKNREKRFSKYLFLM